MEEFFIVGKHGGDFRIEHEGNTFRMYRHGKTWTNPDELVLTYVADPNGEDNVYGEGFSPNVSSLAELRSLLNAVALIEPLFFEETRVFKSLRGQSTT
jgi:hypothetical protein